jgi:hypothetical protein
MCDFCAFHGSEQCPNPSAEWKMIFIEGKTREEAFEYASQHPIEVHEDEAAPLTALDTQNVDNFFRKRRGQAPVTIEKPKRKAAPRKKKVKASDVAGS